VQIEKEGFVDVHGGCLLQVLAPAALQGWCDGFCSDGASRVRASLPAYEIGVLEFAWMFSMGLPLVSNLDFARISLSVACLRLPMRVFNLCVVDMV
jgi:hypothetical protein